MKSMSFAQYVVVIAMVLSAACGDSSQTDARRSGGASPTNPAPDAPASGSSADPSSHDLLYRGLVGTTDVSILYPLPASRQSKGLVRPTESGPFGPLLRQSTFDGLDIIRMLDNDPDAAPSMYPDLALVSLRIDPCSSRGVSAGQCTSEVRVVFQALYDETGNNADPASDAGAAATDGALHVTYDVPDAELVAMLKEILALKAAQGGLALENLGPHPILREQGLDGAFAAGLRSITVGHLGDDRIGRITLFDHQRTTDDPNDQWLFSIYDKVDGTLVRRTIPHFDPGQPNAAAEVVGIGPSGVSALDRTLRMDAVDLVDDLLRVGRPAARSPITASLQTAFDSALRVQNPKIHDLKTTDCVNCHLAEDARRTGESEYSARVSSADAFTDSRSLGYTRELSTRTNLHAFGYLHRQVSIMQRTANESAIVASAMERNLAP